MARLNNDAATGRPNSLGLRGRELAALLDQLDSGDGGSYRTYLRWAFRRETISIELHQPGGSTARVDMVARNLSAGGMSLLHSAFVYPNTKVLVRLPGVSAGFVDVRGKVARCLHVQGRVHEVGVQFDEPVEMRSFTAGDLFDGCFSMDKVDPEKLEGRVLIVDESEIDRRIVHHLLRKTSLRLVDASTLEEAEAELRKGVNLVFAEASVGNGGLIRALRNTAGATPIVAMSADSSASALSRIRGMGADALLPKPIDPNSLLRVLGEFLIVRGSSQEQPASKGGFGDASLRPMVMAELSKLGAALEQCISSDKAEEAHKLALRVKSLAPVAGLEGLAAIAGEAAEAIADQVSCAPGLGALRALHRGLSQVRAA